MGRVRLDEASDHGQPLVRLSPDQLNTLLAPIIVERQLTLVHGNERGLLTLLAHELASGAVRAGGTCIFLDSGTNCRPRLLRSLLRDCPRGALQRVVVGRVLSLSDLEDRLQRVAGVPGASLVVLDSLTGVLNLSVPPGTRGRQRRLFRALEAVRNVLLDSGLHMVATDHSSKHPLTGESRVVGGNVLSHAVDSMVRIDMVDPASGFVRVTVERAPVRLQCPSVVVRVDSTGLHSIREV